MLPGRASVLVVLLIGVGLGLLARPWTEVPGAEAARGKGQAQSVECIFGANALAVLRNTGTAAVEVRQQLFKMDGTVSLDETFTIAAGRTVVLSGTVYRELGAIRFTAPAEVLIDAATDAGEGSRQVACFAGTQRSN